MKLTINSTFCWTPPTSFLPPPATEQYEQMNFRATDKMASSEPSPMKRPLKFDQIADGPGEEEDVWWPAE